MISKSTQSRCNSGEESDSKSESADEEMLQPTDFSCANVFDDDPDNDEGSAIVAEEDHADADDTDHLMKTSSRSIFDNNCRHLFSSTKVLQWTEMGWTNMKATCQLSSQE